LFWIFWDIFELFEFNIRFCSKIACKSLKMFFLGFFRSKRLVLPNSGSILKKWNFEFLKIFPILLCCLIQKSLNMTACFFFLKMFCSAPSLSAADSYSPIFIITDNYKHLGAIILLYSIIVFSAIKICPLNYIII